MASVAASLSTAVLRVGEVEHERAAGEWHVEWFVVPNVMCLIAGAVSTLTDAVRELTVNVDAMGRNLARPWADHG
jgi:3-carboxy-cis,cis-muconate cycloisomerase